MKRVIGCLLICFGIWACQSESVNAWKPKDLLEYGIPVTIMVPNPDSVKVEKDDLGPSQDITLEGEEVYYLQIYVSEAETSDALKIKSDQLELVKEQQFFSQILQEDESGFMFENKIDSTTNYGFRYIVIKGSQEIVFQNHLSKLFSLEEVEKMYESIKESNTQKK